MKFDTKRASRCNLEILRYKSLLSRKSDIQIAVELISDLFLCVRSKHDES